MVRKSHVVLLGAPGTGKGTVAQFLSERAGFSHLSTGNMFRAMAKSRSALGERLNSYLQEGKYVPDQITNAVVKDALDALPEGVASARIILDGYPRTLPQAQYLDTLIEVHAAILLDPSDPEAIASRLMTRLVCPACDRVYNLRSFKGKLCAKDGTALVARRDDDAAIVAKRIAEYRETTEPVVAFYGRKGVLRAIDANLPAETVQAEALRLVGA